MLTHFFVLLLNYWFRFTGMQLTLLLLDSGEQSVRLNTYATNYSTKNYIQEFGEVH
jgi:hypothetical protein